MSVIHTVLCSFTTRCTAVFCLYHTLGADFNVTSLRESTMHTGATNLYDSVMLWGRACAMLPLAQCQNNATAVLEVMKKNMSFQVSNDWLARLVFLCTSLCSQANVYTQTKRVPGLSMPIHMSMYWKGGPDIARYPGPWVPKRIIYFCLSPPPV